MGKENAHSENSVFLLLLYIRASKSLSVNQFVLPPTAKGLNLYQDRGCLGEVVQKGDVRPSSGATIAMVAMVAIRGPLALGLKRHQASFVWPAQRSAVRGYPF